MAGLRERLHLAPDAGVEREGALPYDEDARHAYSPPPGAKLRRSASSRDTGGFQPSTRVARSVSYRKFPYAVRSL